MNPEPPPTPAAAFERAAQVCRYYLKHQNHPTRWERKSQYEQGVQIACENLAELMLEEAAKLKPAPAANPADLLPPAEIIEAAEKVRVWMETNGYRNWQLGGICDRRLLAPVKPASTP
jgi:hypothetical protein